VRTLPSWRYGFLFGGFLTTPSVPDGTWNLIDRTILLSGLPLEEQRGALILNHPILPGVIVYFGINRMTYKSSSQSNWPGPHVYMELLLPEERANNDTTNMYIDRKAPTMWCEKAIARVTASRELTATVKWDTIMGQDNVLVLDITARDSFVDEFISLFNFVRPHTLFILGSCFTKLRSICTNNPISRIAKSGKGKIGLQIALLVVLYTRGFLIQRAVLLWELGVSILNFTTTYLMATTLGILGLVLGEIYKIYHIFGSPRVSLNFPLIWTWFAESFFWSLFNLWMAGSTDWLYWCTIIIPLFLGNSLGVLGIILITAALIQLSELLMTTFSRTDDGAFAQ
jgi:hypothetical protein